MADAPQDRLIVMLEARVTEFEKRMNRADRTMRTNMRNVESHAERMRKRVDASLARVGGSAFRGLIMGATAALAPILSVGAALNGAKSAMADFNKIADQSKMLGLTAERLQELRFAAEQSGMGIANFDTGPLPSPLTGGGGGYPTPENRVRADTDAPLTQRFFSPCLI